MVQTDILDRQIAALESKNLTELQNQFEELYGFLPGDTNAKNLRQRIAWRLQEVVLGGLSETDQTLIEQLADKDPLANLQVIHSYKLNHVRGVRYERVWHDKRYVVTSLGDGKFEYEGNVYRSLSAVTKVITGQKWNGRVFFGVKSNGK